MSLTNILVTYVCLLAVAYVAYAPDPSPLQDFCVGINNPKSKVVVNGMLCKNPMEVKAEDFVFKGLEKPGNTNNRLGSNVSLVTAAELPGLNTLGLSMARLDFAAYGVNAPHVHPRASEILTVIEGTLYAGFVTTNLPLPNGGNKLFAKVLNKGDVFVFPQGLLHFQMNVGKTPALAIVALNSQNPGVLTIANALFGSQPPISVHLLSKAFQLDDHIITHLQSLF